MPTTHRTAALVTALVAMGVLAGCVSETPEPSPSPDPSSTPVFASEEEALAAATEAYEKYLTVSDSITSESGRGSERIEPLVTASYAREELMSFEEFQASGNVTVGATEFDSVRIQQFPGDAGEGDVLTAYLCFDVSGVRLQNATGTDITPPERAARVPLEVDFQIANNSPVELLIGRSEVWAGENFC